MQIVIDIPEEIYNEVCWRGLSLCPRDEANLVKAIRNSTPLPEHHGRLIDADAVDTRYSDPEVVEVLDNAPTIIEGSESE